MDNNKYSFEDELNKPSEISLWNFLEEEKVIIAVLFLCLLSLPFLSFLDIWNIGNSIAVMSSIIALLGVIYSNYNNKKNNEFQNYKSDKRLEINLNENKNNLDKQLRFERKETVYLQVYRTFYDNITIFSKKGYNIKGKIEAIKNIHKSLVEIKKDSNNLFFYLDKDIRIKINGYIAIANHIEEHYSFEKVSYTEEHYSNLFVFGKNIYDDSKKYLNVEDDFVIEKISLNVTLEKV